MATFCFTELPRKRNSNEPLTFSITTSTSGEPVGTLKRQKNKWRLAWNGVAAEFSTRIELQRHFRMLGHRIEGLV